jgi:high-affinity iron transporter
MTDMPAAALLAFREGLEAALILGIVLRYLETIDRAELRRSVWFGAFTAAVGSLVVAAGIQVLGLTLEGSAEGIFEGATMVLAVVILTWMIFWMRSQAKMFKDSLEREVDAAVNRGQRWGLWAVAFLAVFREGIELTLFLSAVAFASGGEATLIGATLGLLASALVGVLIYSSTRRLSVGLFFRVTSVLLLVFAAGLLAHSVHEFQEAGLLSTVNEHVWDTNNLLHEDSPVGQVLKTLTGYNGNPSFEEILAYGLYWIVMVVGIRYWVDRRAESRPFMQSS